MSRAAAQRLGPEAQAIRVVLVVHDEQLRARAREALTGTPGVWVIGEAVEAMAAVIICVVGKPDVVVMDALTLWDDWSVMAGPIRGIEPVPNVIVCRPSSSPDLTAAPATLGLAVAADGWVGLESLVRSGDRPPALTRHPRR